MIKLLENLLSLLENSPSERCKKVLITDPRKAYLKSIKLLKNHLKSAKEF